MKRLLFVLCLATGCADADKQPQASAPDRIDEAFRADTPPDAEARLFSLGQGKVGGIKTLPDLHAAFVDEFINVPNNFGAMRMPYMGPSTSHQWVEYIPESSGGSGGERGTRNTAPSFDPGSGMLTLADGSKLPAYEHRWNTVERKLIGLLGESPAVYVHEQVNLHKLMSKPGGSGNAMPKRTPDAFETRALAKLKEGMEVVASTGRDDMRMVGAIRARADCLSCHKVQTGDLLGAFTYTLKSAPPASEPAVP